jgi:hypothetical protein
MTLYVSVNDSDETPIGDVTVVIPHILTRDQMLSRAVHSVKAQTVRPHTVIISVDEERKGSGAMRDEAVQRVETTWTAFLDDDDEFLPTHLAVLLNHARNDDVDVLYPGCRVYNAHGNEIPRLMEWGRYLLPFDADLLRKQSYIPVTSLVRTELAKKASFTPPANSRYDDWGFYLQLLDMGARFKHVPTITWSWHHHGQNTSGQGTR